MINIYKGRRGSMRNIYTSIDIGSDSVKLLVAEVVKNKINVLAAISKKSKGIKKGLVFDADKAVISVREVINEANAMLGFNVEEVIVNIPSYDVDFKLVKGNIKIENENMEVTGSDITNVLKDALKDELDKDRDLVSILPIGFTLDDVEGIEDPKGIVGSKLEVKAIMITTIKKIVYSFINVCEKAGLKVIDITFSSVSDYTEFRGSNTDSETGAVINFGKDVTTISVFNKGVMISSEALFIGGKHISKDIAYIYKVSNEQSEKLKKAFAIAHKKLANPNDTHEVVSMAGERLKINQYEISEVVIARLEQMLNLTKNRINDLTNKEISYIIITGGTAEMAGFNYLVNDYLGKYAKIGNINTLGIRHNKYSSCIGAIKYFNNKLKLRGKKHSMIDGLDEEFTGRVKKSNESVLNKVFGYFLDS